MLLPSAYFENNSYYNSYKILINTAFDLTVPVEKHHMIPVCYYKQLYQCKTRKQAEKYANSDPANKLVDLPLPQHILAHYYLCNCCINKELKARLINAFLMLASFKHKYTYYLSKKDSELLNEFKTYCEKKLQNIYGKKVICIETGIEYVNICAANEAMGKNRYNYTGIHNVCYKIDNQQTACGYHWCFSDNIQAVADLKKLYFKQNPVKLKNQAKQIFCPETGLIFRSAYEASIKMGVYRDAILACCKHYWKTINTFHFCFLEDKDKFKPLSKPVRKLTAAQKQYIGQKTKEAMSKLTDEQKAAMKLKVYQSWQLKDAHYYNNGIEEIRAKVCPEGWMPGRLAKYKTKGKQIICIELNQVFSSIVEASKTLNISHGSISNCLSCKSKTAGGYHWKYY